MAPNSTDLCAAEGMNGKAKCRSIAGTKEDYYEAIELVKSTDTKEFTAQIRWPDLIAQAFLHAGALYGIYYLITLQPKANTYIWGKGI